MSTKLFNKFWVALTAVITLGLLAYLFPLLLDKYGDSSGLSHSRGYGAGLSSGVLGFHSVREKKQAGKGCLNRYLNRDK